MKPHLVLASRSPRRRELLTQIGIRYTCVSADIDETPRAGEQPDRYVQRLALAKARAGLAAGDGRLPVLGSDTAVVLDGEILGKPADRDNAIAMLSALSGRQHQVMSAVALVDARCSAVDLSISQVSFRPLSASEIQAYCDTDEPYDKAGAYGIQGLAGLFVATLNGSYSGVMGLPLHITGALLKQFGIDPLGPNPDPA